MSTWSAFPVHRRLKVKLPPGPLSLEINYSAMAPGRVAIFVEFGKKAHERLLIYHSKYQKTPHTTQCLTGITVEIPQGLGPKPFKLVVENDGTAAQLWFRCIPRPKISRTTMGIARAWANLIATRPPAPARAELWAVDTEGDDGYLVETSLAGALERAKRWWDENRVGTPCMVVRPCAIALPNDLDAQLHIERITEDDSDVADWSDFAGETGDVIHVEGGDGPERAALWDDLDRRLARALREWALDHGAFDAKPDEGRPRVDVDAWKFTGPARTYEHDGAAWAEVVELIADFTVEPLPDHPYFSGGFRRTHRVESSAVCKKIAVEVPRGVHVVKWTYEHRGEGFSSSALAESIDGPAVDQAFVAGVHDEPTVVNGSANIYNTAAGVWYLFIRSDIASFSVHVSLTRVGNIT